MSLLLEALKKAEKAKEDAQRRAREGDGGGLQLAGETPAEAKHVVTRDELPQITAPLEILSEDLRADPAKSGAREPASQESPAAAAPSPPRSADAQAAQRSTARKVFEAKVREPNPRLPFFILMGALGAFAVGTVIYFWIQLRPQPPLYNTNPQPAPNEVAVPVVPQAPPPLQASTSATGSIPGLPPGPQAALEPVPAAAPAPRKAPPPSAARAPSTVTARADAPPRARPAPRAQTPRPRAEPAAALAANRPAPRVHPAVESGYAAYQAGDMERARADYERTLRDEPGNRDALLGLAAVETRAARFAAAEALYRRLLIADPRDPYAHAGLLALRAQKMDPVAAESRVKGLLAVEPEEGVLHFTLGNQYAQQSRWPEAQLAYAKAAAMNPENPDYAFNLAVSLEHVRQPLPALQQYRRALALALQRTASFDAAAAQARVQQLSH
jgi:tetratricopeptide (TPR) repeat protein